MGLLIAAAALVVLAYAVSSALGLWLAGQAMRAAALGQPPDPPLSEAPAHHRALLADYALGWRGHAWRVSFACLVTTLLGMVLGAPLVPYAFGLALAIDSWLFLTYPGRQAFMAATSPEERLFDAAQCCVLLAAFGILFWTRVQVMG
jgi:hypothetical protein